MNPFVCVLCVLGLASVPVSERNLSIDRASTVMGITVSDSVPSDLSELSGFYRRRQVALYSNNTAVGDQCTAVGNRRAKHRAKYGNNRQIEVYQESNMGGQTEHTHCSVTANQCPARSFIQKKRR